MTREEEIKLEADYSYEGNYKSLQKQCFIEGAMLDVDSIIKHFETTEDEE